MRLCYIANARIPTEKAHGAQIFKTLEALGKLGIEIELIIPRRRNPIKADPFVYYGAERNFKITKLPTIDLVGIIPRFGFLVQAVSFAKFVTLYLLFKKADVIYSRDEVSLYFLSFFRDNLVWESHRGQQSFLVKRLLNKCRGIVTITQAGKALYVKMNADPQKILVAPDGVEIEKFQIPNSKSQIRQELNLPIDKKIVMYTGNFFTWKGVYVLAEAARFLPEHQFVFVGGSPDEQQKFKKHLNRQLTHDRGAVVQDIKLIGHVQHNQIPAYLVAADVLVLPNSGKSDISRYFTSPLKLFEYMAARKPIVASNLPSIREVLGETNSILVEPDNPQALAEGIRKVLENPDLAEKISNQAREDAKKYSWEERAKKILRFLIPRQWES